MHVHQAGAFRGARRPASRESDQVAGHSRAVEHDAAMAAAARTVRDHAGPWKRRLSAHVLGSPDRIRTGATALRGRRPRPLDDGAERGLRGGPPDSDAASGATANLRWSSPLGYQD